MGRNVFKSFDTIGVDTRAGVIISETTKGYKIETFSAYSDAKEYIYYIAFTDKYPSGIQWDTVINEYGTQNYECLMQDIKNENIRPYKTIVK